MAKKGRRGRRRNMRRYVKGNVDEELSLGTLGPKVLVGVDFDEALVESGTISSLEATYSMSGFTPTTSVGPISIGVAHSDYTDAEIEEVLENTGSWDTGNMISREMAKRLVRKIGTFKSAQGAGGGIGLAVLNDGKPIKVKLNWRLTTGDTLKFWAYNEGSAAIVTTVPIIFVQGHANIFYS